MDSHMNYGYIRVSTDKQTVENQRFEITRFCECKNIDIDHWIEETISGSKEPEKRKLGSVLSNLRKGDILICAELSRLGRSLPGGLIAIGHTPAAKDFCAISLQISGRYLT